jgi:hypothetical protein
LHCWRSPSSAQMVSLATGWGFLRPFSPPERIATLVLPQYLHLLACVAGG